ncbi:MAG: hypothetical protein HYU57_09780 [Micavibrio aeruginosavorus]|nr:hypothetical protein [Micavibrio aeruginosavorus]
MPPSRFRTVAAALCLSAMLGGCGFFESSPRQSAAAVSGQNSAGLHLGFYDALALSLQKNTDASIALPEDTASQQDGLSAAWAAIDQSLAPARQHAGQDESRAAEMIIARTRAAYLRAVAADLLQDEVSRQINRAQEEGRMEDAESLTRSFAPFATARQELATLVGLEQPDRVVLDDVKTLLPSGADSFADLAALERQALTNRSEMQSVGELLPDEIDRVRARAGKMFPAGADAATAESWVRFSKSFSDGLSRILGMNLALQNPDTRQKFDLLRQQAVSTAIVAQVGLAHAQMETVLQQAAALAQNPDDPVAALQTEMQRHTTLIALQDAQARIKQTIGIAPVPAQPRQKAIASLSAALRERDGDLAPVVMLAAQQDLYQHPEIVPAAFHPVDFGTRIPLPQKLSVQENPENSIFSRFIGKARTLRIPEGRMRALLEAPIMEP